jgi:hypothetical protein
MVKDALLELLQARAWFETVIVESHPESLVEVERFVLSAGSVEREHVQLRALLVIRVEDRQPVEQRQDLIVSPEPQLGVQQAAQRRAVSELQGRSELVRPRTLEPGERLVGLHHVGAAPLVDGSLVLRGGAGVVGVRGQLLGSREVVVEAMHVDSFRRYPCRVASAMSHHQNVASPRDCLIQRAAQIADEAVEEVARGHRRSVAPNLVNQAVAGHNAASPL